MMDSENPYQAPIEPAALLEREGGFAVEGELLVVGRQTVLPMRCVVTNAPATPRDRIQRRLDWAPSFQLVLRKRTCRLTYYRTRSRHQVRIRLILGSFIVVAGAISSALISGLLFALPVAVISGFAIIFSKPNDLSVRYYCDGHFWIAGCGPEFLASCQAASGGNERTGAGTAEGGNRR